MKFVDLLSAFKKCQPLQRKKDWKENEYCGIDELGMYWRCGHPGTGTITTNFIITIADLEADDWDFYFPPKAILTENQKDGK